MVHPYCKYLDGINLFKCDGLNKLINKSQINRAIKDEDNELLVDAINKKAKDVNNEENRSYFTYILFINL